MTKDVIIKEITSIIDYIEETKNRVELDHDKFQVALSSTLRLLGDTNPTLTKLKGDAEALKGYLVRTSTEIKETAVQPYHQLKQRMEKVLGMLQKA
ncbi:MAG: hypothetical protein RTV41_02245 [Candidatus Thorarchaeota archaeon]